MFTYFLNSFESLHLVELSQLLNQYQDKVLALGEIGLDTHIDVDWQLQLQVFEQQLLIAEEHMLPVILHHRNSHNFTKLTKFHKTQTQKTIDSC